MTVTTVFLGKMLLGMACSGSPAVSAEVHHCHLFCELGAVVCETAHFAAAVPVETSRFFGRTAGRTIEYGGGLIKETGRFLGGVGRDFKEAGHRLRRRF